MSCVNCGQDVPVVPSADDPDAVTCLRCRSTFLWASTSPRTLHVDASHRRSSDVRPSRSTSRDVPPLVATDDDWDDMFDPCSRWHPKEDPAATLKDESMTDTNPTGQLPRRQRRARSHWVQWLLLSVGVTLFTAGAVLIGWSFYDDRQGLWSIGTPLALAGQVVFLVGLILQLDVLWQQSKVTARAIEAMDGRRASADHVVPEVSRPRQALRSGVDDNSTQHLLHDLKGQLDQFATRLSSHSRI